MIIYLKKLEKTEKLKFIEKLKMKLNKLIIRNIDENRKIVMFPIDEKNQDKMLKLLNNKIDSNCKIVISKKLKKLEGKIQCKVIKGKLVQKALLDKILQLAVGNLKVQDIHIVSQKYNLDVVKTVDYLVEKVKTVNIVTNEIAKYKKLEETYADKGILITVTNNRKKSLKRAGVVINFDMNNEELNSYNVNRNAIIINLADTTIDKITGFEGIIINNVEIELSEEIRKIFTENNLYEYFDNSALYESINNSIDINNKDIRLKEIVGNNGVITYDEINRCKKLKSK